MKFRQARKILRAQRPARYATVMAAMRRLELRAERWRRKHDYATPNPRPTFTLKDLFGLPYYDSAGYRRFAVHGPQAAEPPSRE
jgi:hypothetical protein